MERFRKLKLSLCFSIVPKCPSALFFDKLINSSTFIFFVFYGNIEIFDNGIQ
jgi:hypothetical protein